MDLSSDRMEFGLRCLQVNENIKKYRRKAGLSGAQLAQIIGITQSTLVRYENGGVKFISPAMIEKIAVALSCSFDDLTDGDPRYDTEKGNNSSHDTVILRQYHALRPELRSIVDQILNLSSL